MLGTGSSESKTGLVRAVAPSLRCHLGLSRVQKGSWKRGEMLSSYRYKYVGRLLLNILNKGDYMKDVDLLS